MKIVVAILTRENPLGLITLVGGLHGLESGTNDVRYVVRYDGDDQASYEAVQGLSDWLPGKVYEVVLPRPVTLGEAWNDALRSARFWDWEVCATFPGDVIPMCDQWDSILAGFLSVDKHPGVSWTQLCDPQAPVFPCVRREWFDALGGKLFPEWFPFWFSDTWVIEVSNLAFGSRLPIVTNLILGGKHASTSGMRDLRWWFSAFAKTRVLRIREAETLASALGWPRVDPGPIIVEMEKSDDWQQGRVSQYEKVFNADVGVPSERYLKAKMAMQNLLKDLD